VLDGRVYAANNFFDMESMSKADRDGRVDWAGRKGSRLKIAGGFQPFAFADLASA
jgi:hypothetical protein